MTHRKHELARAFSPPPPTGKRYFLRHTSHFQMSSVAFLQSQLRYIKKWVWCAAALLLMLGILGAAVLSLNMLWIIAACTPILAMTFLSESGRSQRHQMEELELSTRFSLRNVILARFAILGLTDLLLLLLLLPLALLNNSCSLLAAGLTITTPFLLTVWIGLAITRKYRGRDGLYACWSAACCISISVILSQLKLPHIYQEQHILWWSILCIALCIAIGKHSVGIIQQTEELSWN